MKPRVIFVERKTSASVSIERVFRQIAGDLPADRFDVEFQTVPYGNGIFAILRNLAFFRKRPADIYHITGDVHYISLVLPRNRTILTIHDLVALRRGSGVRKYLIKKLFLDFPVRRCAQITTVSDAVKQEIIDRTGIRGDRVAVIENPLIDGFQCRGEKPFNPDCPVILHIGTAENKNLERLIAAVEGLTCKLRIVGRLDDKIIQRLRHHNAAYENVFGLDQKQIIEEYENADIVSFCSIYEGFGLPIIEAQAMRKPVVTSDLPPMNAVAGDGAALVDPYDISSIKRALIRIIDDPEYRNTIIDAGARNVSRFDGKAIAGRYAELYEEILSQTDSQ